MFVFLGLKGKFVACEESSCGVSYAANLFIRRPTMQDLLLLFIAILPSRAVQEEVTTMKQYIAKRWGPCHALKSPPHITLQPPFQWTEARMQELSQCLHALVSVQKPFWVILHGYGAFAPRVFFIQPELSPPLKVLFTKLKERLTREFGSPFDRKDERTFHPHMTLAHRDMEPVVFDQIWADFQKRPYQRAFSVNSLALLQWKGHHWEVREEFPFGKG